jgi:hypothetical protein
MHSDIFLHTPKNYFIVLPKELTVHYPVRSTKGENDTHVTRGSILDINLYGVH